MGKADVTQASCADGIRAGHKVVEKHAETVDVALDGGFAAGKNLRRQIKGRSGQIGGGVVRELASRAKVHQHGPAVFSQHHVLGLDVTMQQALVVHGRNRLTELNADLSSFRPAEHFAFVNDLLERAAPDEFHPETDPSSNLLGAVDRDYVRMTHAGEQPAFLDDGRRRTVAGRSIRGQQLERHLPIEPGVPGPIHVAECAAADPLEHAQMSPVFYLFATIPSVGDRGRCWRKKQTTVKVGESGEHSELGEQWTAGLVCAGFGCGPVDRRAIEHGACKIGNEPFTHAPRFISSANRTSARCAALRAASGVGLPSASASSS